MKRNNLLCKMDQCERGLSNHLSQVVLNKSGIFWIIASNATHYTLHSKVDKSPIAAVYFSIKRNAIEAVPTIEFLKHFFTYI